METMKKFVVLIVISILILVTIVFTCLIVTVKNYYAKENEKISMVLQVKRIIIMPLDDDRLDRIRKYSMFDDFTLDGRTEKDVLSNPLNYKTLAFEYDFKNNANSITVEGLKTDPIFIEKLNKLLVGYFHEPVAPEAVTYDPGRDDLFRQPILIKTVGISDSELFSLAKESKIKVSYYLGKNFFKYGWKNKIFDISPNVRFSTSY